MCSTKRRCAREQPPFATFLRGRTAYSKILYAGKAYLSPALMHILVEEGIGLDVVSGGEIHAGLLAGVDPADMLFHGNNKSRAELELALRSGIGLIAVDNEHEIGLLEEVTGAAGHVATVVLRLNPGVDPHTHHKMRTGAVDSKFGFPVWDGQAERAATRVAAAPRIRLAGYHAHVGSQIFDAHLVEATIDTMMTFAATMHDRFGVIPEVIVPGGGFGVADDASGTDVSIVDWATAAATALTRGANEHNLPLPRLMVEPGRAIIGPAGVALYEVGAQKAIPGGRAYVSVDGGMADNIRPSLYGAVYTAALASRDAEDGDRTPVTIAGKYCESGDVLIEQVFLPPLQAGDVLAVPMAGAYCLAMASNYNLSPRPAAVLVSNGDARLIRRRETYADILSADILPTVSGARTVLPRLDCLSARKGSL